MGKGTAAGRGLLVRLGRLARLRWWPRPTPALTSGGRGQRPARLRGSVRERGRDCSAVGSAMGRAEGRAAGGGGGAAGPSLAPTKEGAQPDCRSCDGRLEAPPWRRHSGEADRGGEGRGRERERVNGERAGQVLGIHAQGREVASERSSEKPRGLRRPKSVGHASCSARPATVQHFQNSNTTAKIQAEITFSSHHIS